MSIEAMQQALKCTPHKQLIDELLDSRIPKTEMEHAAAREIEKLRERLAQSEQAEQDHTYGYAKGLAEAIFKQHFASDEHYASGRVVWGVNDTVIGILTQIDNMVAGMVRKPHQAEQAQPVAWLGYHFKTGLPDFAYDMPTPSVMRDFNMRPLVYGDTPPPPRKPLTDEQIMANAVLRYHFALNGGGGPISKQGHKIIDAIEAAHGIKGEDLILRGETDE